MGSKLLGRIFSSFLNSKKIIDDVVRNSRTFSWRFCQFAPKFEPVIKVNSGYRNRIRVPSLIGVAGAGRCLSLFSSKEEDKVVLNIKEAEKSVVMGDAKSAENYYHEALKAADEKFQKNKISETEHVQARTYIYDGLANLALSQGQFENAEKLFKETMKGYLQTGKKETDNAMVELSVKLAVIYAMISRDSEAVLGYEFAIKTQEAKLQENPDSDHNTKALLGLALESYGRYKLLHKEIDNALVMLKQASDIATLVMGRSHPQTLVLLNDIATAYVMKRDYEQAEKCIRETIVIAEKAKIPEISTFYCNLGSLFLRMSRLEDAKQYCEIALTKSKLFKDKLGVQHATECLSKIDQTEKEEQKR